MIKDGKTKESERPGDTGIEGLQHHRGAERPGDAGSAVRGGQRVSPRHHLEHCARAGEAPAGWRDGGRADPQSRRHGHHDPRQARAGRLEVTLASSATAFAVKAGAPRPDISTPEALKRTLLAARAISYSDPAAGGASGIYFAKLLERLGIASEVNAKTKFPPPAGLCGDLLKRRRRPCRAAEARAAAGSRHRDPGAAARRPAHGHGVRRWRGSVERRACAGQALIDFLRSPASAAASAPRDSIRPDRPASEAQAPQRLRAWLSVPDPMLNPLQHDCHPERSA